MYFSVGGKCVGSPLVLAGKCVSNPRFEAGYHISNYSLGFKKLLKFSSCKQTRGKKSEKTGKKGDRLPSNEEKMREIQ